MPGVSPGPPAVTVQKLGQYYPNFCAVCADEQTVFFFIMASLISNIAGNYLYDRVKAVARPYLRKAEDFVVRRLTTDPIHMPNRYFPRRGRIQFARRNVNRARIRRYKRRRPLGALMRKRACPQARVNSILLNASKGIFRLAGPADATVSMGVYHSSSLIMSSRGADLNSRDGDHIHIYGIHVHMRLNLLEVTASANYSGRVWVALMLDRHPDGAQAAGNAVFDNAPFDEDFSVKDHETIRFKNRFKFLTRPKKIYMRSREVGGVAAGNKPGSLDTIEKFCHIKWGFRKRQRFIKVEYNGNAGTIADVQANNVYVVYYYEGVDEKLLISAESTVYFIN